jgi:hypothetical protein
LVSPSVCPLLVWNSLTMIKIIPCRPQVIVDKDRRGFHVDVPAGYSPTEPVLDEGTTLRSTRTVQFRCARTAARPAICRCREQSALSVDSV